MSVRFVIQGNCTHEVSVIYLKKKGYSIRVYTNGELNQQSIVDDKMDIGSEISSMLRMEDKCGNISKMAYRSRHRKWEKMDKLKAWNKQMKKTTT